MIIILNIDNCIDNHIIIRIDYIYIPHYQHIIFNIDSSKTIIIEDV